jgi:hypothetical protein
VIKYQSSHFCPEREALKSERKMNGEVAFQAKKIRLFYTPCFKPWNISHPTIGDSISFPPFASCDIDLYSFLSNILYVCFEGYGFGSCL